MKARVKATGEIIELCNMEFDEDGNEYYRDELELIGDYEPDYWEKLKHQYAGMAMQGILSNKELYDTITECVWPPKRPAYISERCDEFATALVNRLKEESQCK